MARRTITLTGSNQLLSSAACVITVQDGSGSIQFNDTDSDTDALSLSAKPGDQFNVGEDKDTYAKSITGILTLVIVDGE